MKKNKSVNGGILLEVLFMLSIMIGIFPIIQKNTKKRTDEIRNKMVVNDLLKIKDAVENYLKQDIEVNNPGSFVGNIKISELYDMGLPKTFVEKEESGGFFTNENILGQQYEVKIKKTVDPANVNNVSYSAIIIAKDPSKSIPVMRIRDIIKETKGYAGYLEKEGDNYMIYGQNWQLNGNEWGLSGDDNPYKNAIFLRAGTSKKEYEYISRKPGAGRNNVMRTTLQMNNQNINTMKNLYIEKSIDVGLLKLTNDTGFSEFERISISGYEADDGDNESGAVAVIGDQEGAGAGAGSLGELGEIGKASFTISGPMIIGGALKFPLGLLMNNLFFEDDATLFVKLQQRLKTTSLKLDTDKSCNYSDSYSDNCNRAQKITALRLKDNNSIIEFAIANLLKVNNFTVENLLTSSFDSAAKEGLKVTSITTQNNICNNSCGKGQITSSKINLNDIILRDVNSKFTLVGGIAIGPRTPLSVVFRALYYEYADAYKSINEAYPSHFYGLKWCYLLHRRYEQADNDATGWWGNDC